MLLAVFVMCTYSSLVDFLMCKYQVAARVLLLFPFLARGGGTPFHHRVSIDPYLVKQRCSVIKRCTIVVEDNFIAIDNGVVVSEELVRHCWDPGRSNCSADHVWIVGAACNSGDGDSWVIIGKHSNRGVLRGGSLVVVTLWV